MKKQVKVWDKTEWITVLHGEIENKRRIIREDGSEFTIDVDPDRELDDQILIELRRRTSE